MATQVKMWIMKGDYVVLHYYNKFKVLEEEIYALLMVSLEEKTTLEWV